MKDFKRLVLIIIAILSASFFGIADEQRIFAWLSDLGLEGNSYRVVSVADGDTIVVSQDGKEERVRLIGVDTPETHHPSKPVQCFGEAASQFTKDLLPEGTIVNLEADPINSNRDIYQRLLRYVYLEDGTLLNSEIIKQGYGFAYLSFGFEKLDEFELIETRARENNKGLWAGCDVSLDSNESLTTNDAANGLEQIQ